MSIIHTCPELPPVASRLIESGCGLNFIADTAPLYLFVIEVNNFGGGRDTTESSCSFSW
jgi:hypothetical protein